MADCICFITHKYSCGCVLTAMWSRSAVFVDFRGMLLQSHQRTPHGAIQEVHDSMCPLVLAKKKAGKEEDDGK